jgi:chaperone modulatory protein CbpM
MTTSVDDFLARSGIERGALQLWIEQEWIMAAPGELLSNADASRAYLVHELIDDFGVNEEGVSLILHLVDQIHGLRLVLQSLRDLDGFAEAQLQVTRPTDPSH